MRLVQTAFRSRAAAITLLICLAPLAWSAPASATEAEANTALGGEVALARVRSQAPPSAPRVSDEEALEVWVGPRTDVRVGLARTTTPSAFRVRSEALLQYATPLRIGGSDLRCRVRVPGRKRSLVMFELLF